MDVCEPSLNDGNTEHVPNNFLSRVIKKSIVNLPWKLPAEQKCWCFPSKNGFLVLAYFRLLLSIALFLGIIHYLQLMYLIFSRDEMFNHGVGWTALWVNVVDIIIGVVIIISAYKKNQRLMEIYHRYSIYICGFLSVLCCLLFHLMYRNIYALLITIIIFVLVILLQVYLNRMVKIEVLKLRDITDYQILNNDQEPLCIYINNADN